MHRMVVSDTLNTREASWEVRCECGWRSASVMTEEAADEVAAMHRRLEESEDRNEALRLRNEVLENEAALSFAALQQLREKYPEGK